MRHGLLEKEVEKMRKQIAAGLTWEQISPTLDPDDDRKVAREQFYLPLKAEFDKLPPPPPPPVTTQVCPGCHARQSITMKFCGDCGRALSQPDDGLGLDLESKSTKNTKPNVAKL